MSYQDLSVCLLQTPIVWEDKDANFATLEEKIREAQASSPDIVVLPEMFTTGFSMNTALAEPPKSTTHRWMRQLAAATGAAICGSYMVRDGGQCYNRFLWLCPDGSYHYYDKRHLFSFGQEDNYFSPGSKQLIIEWKSWRIMPLVCYDLRFPVWSRHTFHNSYDCLLYVANWPSARALAWNTLLRARAIENVAYTIGVNRVGVDEKGLHYQGDSNIYDFAGKAMSESTDKESIVHIVLRHEPLSSFRASFRALEDGDSFGLSI